MIKLPTYQVTKVIASLSEIQDWGLREFNIPKAWSITKGEDITICIIDTGGSFHPDLYENVNYDYQIDTTEENEWEDKTGHSTHCGGVIAAEQNGMGMVGIAPKAKLIFIKALDSSGTGKEEYLIEALKHCKKIRPDIISMSLGSPYNNPRIHKLIQDLYLLNIPCICATGNDGKRGVDFPAAYPETIACGALDKGGVLAEYSNYGPEADFVAPGSNIYSTWLNNRYARISGTSMATPFLTGILALLLSRHRTRERITGENDCKTVEQMKEHLIRASQNGQLNYNEQYGFGPIDVEKLLEGPLDNIVSLQKPEKTSISIIKKIISLIYYWRRK